jgi:hypothetical protein
MMRPSFIQRFGSTAAMAAARRPRASPPSRRPSPPTRATVPQPIRTIVKRMASSPAWPGPRRAPGRRAITVNGGWSAFGSSACGSTRASNGSTKNPSPSAITRAESSYQVAS